MVVVSELNVTPIAYVREKVTLDSERIIVIEAHGADPIIILRFGISFLQPRRNGSFTIHGINLFH